MKREVYRFVIDDSISMDEVEATLLLAILAVECLFGESRIRMEAAYSIAKDKHTCVIDATNDVGESICRVFTGYLTREFWDNAFTVRPITEREKCAVADTVNHVEEDRGGLE